MFSDMFNMSVINGIFNKNDSNPIHKEDIEPNPGPQNRSINWPKLPDLPKWPKLPKLPKMPDIEIPDIFIPFPE